MEFLDQISNCLLIKNNSSPWKAAYILNYVAKDNPVAWNEAGACTGRRMQ